MNAEERNLVWGFHQEQPLTAEPCPACAGEGRFVNEGVPGDDCEHCDGKGWFGIDPHRPVVAPPGSNAKIAMLSVRYASGVPLWNEQDGPPPAEDAHHVRLAP